MAWSGDLLIRLNAWWMVFDETESASKKSNQASNPLCHPIQNS